MLQPLQRTWRKASTLFAVWLAHMSVERAEIVIWMLSGMVPLMMAIGIRRAGSGALNRSGSTRMIANTPRLRDRSSSQARGCSKCAV